MPGMPDLPVDVDPTVQQTSGMRDPDPVYQTHRGPKRRSVRSQGDLPPRPERANGWMRYEDQ